MPLVAQVEPAAPTQRHPGWSRAFPAGRLTVGAFLPLDPFGDGRTLPVAPLDRAQRAEAAGLTALWARDVPLWDPAFGDGGQLHDPLVFLGHLAAVTSTIALGTASTVLPLRDPLHLAKAAASVDRLSAGRLLLGVTTGDRPVEYPAFGRSAAARDEDFAVALERLRAASRPGPLDLPTVPPGRGLEVLPDPWGGVLRTLVTGRAGRPLSWIVRHADGWITAPQPADRLAQWRDTARRLRPEAYLPIAEPFALDLLADPAASPRSEGRLVRTGAEGLVAVLRDRQDAGVGHVVLDLRTSSRPIEDVLADLGRSVVPHFPAGPGRATPQE